MKNPKVYISYSHDSEDFKNWALEFCDRLRSKGIDAIIDQYQLLLTDSMPEFMEKGITESDFVIFLITDQFIKKYERRKGGVGYEINISTGKIFVKGLRKKFVPVLIYIDFDQVPPFLLGIKGIRITNLKDYNKEFIELYAYLTGQKVLEQPPLGSIVPLEDLKNELNTSDIDIYKKKTQMTQHVNWNLEIKALSFADWDFARIYNGLSKHFLTRRGMNETKYFPLIFAPRYRKALSPSVVYKSDNYLGSFSNWFMFEKAIFEANKLKYNFIELTNNEIIIMNMRVPLLSIWFILKTYRDFHISSGTQVRLDARLELETSLGAFYNFQRPLFQLNYNSFESYKLKDLHLEIKYSFQSLDKTEIYNFFQKIISLFVSDNPRSSLPFLEIDINDFDQIYQFIEGGKYEY